MSMWRLFHWSILIAVWAGGSVCAEGEISPATTLPDVQVRLGLGGVYKLGAWTPVRVTLRGDAAREVQAGKLRLVVPDGDGVGVVYTAKAGAGPVSSEATATAAAEFYVRIGRQPTHLELSVEGEDGVVVWSHRVEGNHLRRAVRSDQSIVLTLGEPLGIEQAVRLRHEMESRRELAVVVREFEELPDEWIGYGAIDTIVFTTAAGGMVDRLSSAQHAALRLWMRMGGHAIVSFASGRADLPRAFSEPWPSALESGAVMRNAGALESFAQSRATVKGAGGARLAIPLVALDATRGDLLLDDLIEGKRHPLLVRYPMGFGVVTAIAFDVRDPAIAAWSGRSAWLGQLLGAVTRSEGIAGEERRAAQASQFGYTDLSGQLRLALENFPHVQAMSLGMVVAIVLVYLAMIGPLDYFLLRRLGKRMEWTWITFPLLVLGFCLAAWQIAFYAKGTSLRANQVDLVDIDAASGFTRGTTWFHLYSPQGELFDLQLAPKAPFSPGERSSGVVFSWDGLPGKGIGGMDSSAASVQAELPYEQVQAFDSQAETCRFELRSTPLRTWSSKAFQGRWWRTGEPIASQLAATDYGLVGTLSNPLPFAIESPLVVYRGLCYRLPADLSAGEKFTLSDSLPSRDIRGVLTRRHVVDVKKSSQENAAWDVGSVEVDRILEIMMHYQAAGGEAYTGLAMDYQPEIDLSETPYLGRAVVVGRVRSAAAALARAGEPIRDPPDGSWTFVRLVFPVSSRK